MSLFHVYITPFVDDQGSGYGEEIEVTEDVQLDSMSDLTQALDNTDYDIGIFRTDNISFKIMNDQGKYSSAGTNESIFKFRRGGSLFRLTWEPGNGPLVCGFFQPNRSSTILGEEIEIFRGLIKDDTTYANIDDQVVNLTVLGYESLLQETSINESGEEPYDSISFSDFISVTIFKILNQAPFNQLVTVDQLNIVAGTDPTLDTKVPLENKTVIEALQNLLLVSNSVLYIKENVVYVSPRDAKIPLAYSFYGQASNNGIENVVNIQSYRNGENRIFNFLTWKDTAVRATDPSSISIYGVQKKEVDLDVITDPTKQGDLMAEIVAEFDEPKREFDLTTPLTSDRLVLFLLDKVSVDYPPLSLPPQTGQNIAIYGLGEYDRDYYPNSLFALTIENTARFKIMTRKISFKDETILFHLREV